MADFAVLFMGNSYPVPSSVMQQARSFCPHALPVAASSSMLPAICVYASRRWTQRTGCLTYAQQSHQISTPSRTSASSSPRQAPSTPGKHLQPFPASFFRSFFPPPTPSAPSPRPSPSSSPPQPRTRPIRQGGQQRLAVPRWHSRRASVRNDASSLAPRRRPARNSASGRVGGASAGAPGQGGQQGGGEGGLCETCGT